MFKLVFVLNKKHIPIAIIKLKIELIPKPFKLNEINTTPYIKKMQHKYIMVKIMNSIKGNLVVELML